MNKCPVCQMATLMEVLLEAELPARQCSNCGGVWVSSNDYLVWLKTLEDEPQQEPVINKQLPPTDSDKPTICPDCGRFLRRYRIWPDMEFHLDRCETCNGVWFDQLEWQAVKDLNLEHQVNAFFTRAWQDKIKQAEVRERLEQMYEERFGEEDYGRIQEIREWLQNHPKGPYLLAFLTDKEPYEIKTAVRMDGIR